METMEKSMLQGRILEGEYCSQIYKEGMTFAYQVHVPDYDGKCAVIVTHDALIEADAYAMQVLAARGEAPWCITVGVMAGRICDGFAPGEDRNMRMDCYDVVSAAYPDFVVEELIPFLIREYDLQIDENPDMHMAGGGSSGGISAWNMAWQRNDYFRRVYMSSPSFLAMGSGNEYPVLIRKYEPKPIRVFVDYSENEPNDYFGSSYCAALESVMALEFAGYDMESRYYPEEGHCSRLNSVEDAVERMTFLWKNWDKEAITVKGMSSRMEKVIPLEGQWKETAEAFPERTDEGKTAAGIYEAKTSEIWFTSTKGEQRCVAEGYSKITAIAVSADRKRLYVADLDRSCIYASLIQPDGSLKGRFLHAVLHHLPDDKCAGAYDLCVSSCDRVFAVSDQGIQSVRAFGLIDVILALPYGKVPERIAFGGDNGKELYALAEGTVYKRKILDGGKIPAGEIGSPLYTSYYD